MGSYSLNPRSVSGTCSSVNHGLHGVEKPLVITTTMPEDQRGGPGSKPQTHIFESGALTTALFVS